MHLPAMPSIRHFTQRYALLLMLMLGAAAACTSRQGATDAAGEGARATKPTENPMAAVLPSWNDSPGKQAIVDFVARATKEGGPDFVAPAERIAVFDNDGTLWSEQPMYVQLQFALDRVKALAPQHPEWKEQEPFKHLLAGDMKAFMAGGEKSLMALIATTHTGMTTEEFNKTASDWIASAKHPKTGRPYTEMV